MTEFERGAKVRRINTLMSACRLIPNREDILALWDARSYDELTDDEIVALQAYMELPTGPRRPRPLTRSGVSGRRSWHT